MSKSDSLPYRDSVKLDFRKLLVPLEILQRFSGHCFATMLLIIACKVTHAPRKGNNPQTFMVQVHNVEVLGQKA